MSLKKWITIGATSLLIALGVGSYLFITSHYAYTRDAQIEGFSVNLSPDILARIIALNVDEGDFVEEGQLIAQLQDDILLSQKQESEANIIRSEERLKFARAHFEKVRNDYGRAEQGIMDQIISAQDFDHRQKDYEMAKADLDYALADLEYSMKQLEVINTRLSHTVVVAPMNGMIAKRWVLTGDVMNPGQTMFTMFDLKDVWVLARLEEKKIAKVRIGDPVDIYVDAYPGYTFKGKVFVIKAAAASNFSLIPQDNATGNYTKVEQRIPIKITIERPENFPQDQPLYLLPGMNVEVKIITSGNAK
jgi:membrane fusion protein (multidrug efflux system)